MNATDDPGGQDNARAAHERAAKTHDRAAEVHEKAANLHEAQAAKMLKLVQRAEWLADRERELAEQQHLNGDGHRRDAQAYG